MKITALALIAFLGIGCAAKKMAANNADYLLENQIEKRLPLYAAQEEQLAKDVDKFLNEQKNFAKEVIPLVMDIELDVHKVDSQYEKLKSLYQRLSLSFSKLMSKHMAPLDDKQQKDFAQILKEENYKLTQLKSNEQMNHIYDRFHMIFGTMSEQQKGLLKAQKKYLYQRHLLRVERRQKLHQRFIEIYQMDMSKDSLAQAFYEAFADYQKIYPDDEKNKEIIKAIIPTLSNAQKKHFEEHKKDLREILGYYLDANY